MHICISSLTIIDSDNGLSPGCIQAIIWTNDRILLIGLLGTNFNDILIEIRTFSLIKMLLKMSSGKWRPFSLSLIVLNNWSKHSLSCWKNGPYISCGILCVVMHVENLITTKHRADSRLAPNQWETSLQSNAVFHWLGANLASPENICMWKI